MEIYKKTCKLLGDKLQKPKSNVEKVTPNNNYLMLTSDIHSISFLSMFLFVCVCTYVTHHYKYSRYIFFISNSEREREIMLLSTVVFCNNSYIHMRRLARFLYSACNLFNSCISGKEKKRILSSHDFSRGITTSNFPVSTKAHTCFHTMYTT